MKRTQLQWPIGGALSGNPPTRVESREMYPAEFFAGGTRQSQKTWYHQESWPLLCSGPAVSLRRERRGFFVVSTAATSRRSLSSLHHRRTFCWRTIARRSCTTATPATCRSSTSTVIFRRPKSPRTAASRTSRNLAPRRPLQVAANAGGRRAGTLLHGRRLGPGEVPEVGRDRAAGPPQPGLPLDPP